MRVRFCASFVELNLTSRSGSRYGRGRRKTELTTLKNPTFAPVPSARPRTATSAKPGDLSSWRMANGPRACGLRSATIAAARCAWPRSASQGILWGRSYCKPACVHPAPTGLRAALGTDQPPVLPERVQYDGPQGDRYGTYERHNQTPRQ